MKIKGLFLFLLLTSCYVRKNEGVIIWIKDPSYLLWKENKVYCKDKKDDNIILSFNILSPFKIPHNIYNYGFDSLTISSACNYDGIIFSVSDINMDTEKISEYFNYSSTNIIASNVYIKSNMKSFKKYIFKNLNSKKVAIYCVISDLESPTRSFYLKNFRIENPAFEINRLNYKLKPDKYILILQTQKTLTTEQLSYFKKLFESLTIKPLLVFADVNKPFSVDAVKIFPLPSSSQKISMESKFGILKVKQTNITEYTEPSKISDIERIRKKTNEEFFKKLRFLKQELSAEQLNEIVAKSLVNFISSDIAIIDRKTVTDGLKEGNVIMEDIYRVFKNPWDKVVYIKIKGNLLNDMLKSISDTSTIYINSKLGKQPTFEKNKIYRMFTTLDFIKANDSILNYITEFSILNIQIKHPFVWYLKNKKEL